jgi:DNA-binding NtrC family response regulator
VLPINIPSLRQRKEDIPYLAEHFAAKISAEMGVESTLSDAALDKLVAYDWPGNVRELENVIERSMVLSGHRRLEADDIKMDASRSSKASQTSASNVLPEGVSLDQHEQAIIKEALHRAAGNKSQAARILGITRNALRYRLTQMGIES